jgi:dihydroorotase
MRLIKKDGKAKAEATIYHSLMDHDDLHRLGARGKTNPPMRERSDADYIFRSLLSGDIDYVGTDHAPHTLEEKGVHFMEAPTGVPTTEYYGSFAALLLSRGMEPGNVARVTSYNATQFFGLEAKGRIEEGFLADLAVLDTAGRVKVKPPYQTKCGWSPLEGMEFPGSVTRTIRRGRIIAENGKVLV